MYFVLQWLVDTFGYYNAVKIKDALEDICWLSAGIFIWHIWFVWFSQKIDRDRQLNPHVSLMTALNGSAGREIKFVTNPNGYLELLSVVFIMHIQFVKHLFGWKVKHYRLRRDEVPRKQVAITFFLLGLFIVLGMMFVSHEITPRMDKKFGSYHQHYEEWWLRHYQEHHPYEP